MFLICTDMSRAQTLLSSFPASPYQFLLHDRVFIQKESSPKFFFFTVYDNNGSVF